MEYVDLLGDMAALFPKIRYTLRRLPPWMLPHGFTLGGENDNHARIINPVTGSVIKGESNNQYFGTSGRFRAALFDEFSKWDHTDEAAWQACSDTTDCKIAVSSANGTSNQFFKLRDGQVGKIKVLRLPHTLHPLKDDKWLEEQKKRRSKADVASEILIDYHASVTNKAYPSFQFDVHCGQRVYCDPKLPIMLNCDWNIQPMSWAVGQSHKGHDYYFDEVVDDERTTTEPHIAEFCMEYDDHPTKVLEVYGDPSGQAGSTRGDESDFDIVKRVAEKYGWEVHIRVLPGNIRVKARLNTVDKRLHDWEHMGTNWIHIDPINCPTIINSFEQTRRKGDGINKKDNVEHITDAIGAKQCYTHPLKKEADGPAPRYRKVAQRRQLH